MGRRYVRLDEGDKVVMATVLKPERARACSWRRRRATCMHFPLEEINILSGVGKGVIGIKLEQGRRCAWAAP